MTTVRRVTLTIVLLASAISCSNETTSPITSVAGVSFGGRWALSDSVGVVGSITLRDTTQVSTNPDTASRWASLNLQIIVDGMASGTASLASNGIPWPAASCGAMRYRTWLYPQFRVFPYTATTADTTYSIRIQCAAGAAVNGTTFAFGAVVTSKTPIAAATQALDFVTDYLSSSGLSGSAPYRGIRLTLSRQP